MTWNPYDELGIDPKANQAAIKRAYRDRAKTAHPDAGGTEEGWAKVALAYAVLTNAQQRKTFDTTGKIEQPEINNDRPAALGLIDQQFGNIINAYIANGFREDLNPERIDVPGMIRQNVLMGISEGRNVIAAGERALKTAQAVARRLTVKDPSLNPDGDPLQRSLAAQIEHIKENLNRARGQLRVQELALTILQNYSFDYDRTQQPLAANYYAYNSVTGSTG